MPLLEDSEVPTTSYIFSHKNDPAPPLNLRATKSPNFQTPDGSSSVAPEWVGKLHIRPLSSVSENTNTEDFTSTSQTSKSSDSDFGNTVMRYNYYHKLVCIDLIFDHSISYFLV